MTWSFEPLRLGLTRPFRIAHGTSTVRENVLVRLGSGVGEGALPPYYPYDTEDVLAYLNALDPTAWLADTPVFLEDALDRLPPGPPPARAAVDMALHDHWGRQLGEPLYRLWGLNPARAPRSSRTLSIPDDLAAFRDRLHGLSPVPILKLKLGSGDPDRDEAIVRTAHEVTEAALCVDANGAWSPNEAAALIPRLAAHDVQFVEQPVAAEPPDLWPALREQLSSPHLPPLIADESIQSTDDVLALAGVVDGINVKLAKSGGLRSAHRLITLARTLNLKVMLGCMIESSIALTAAAHLAPLVDFLDLDGHLHLASDPFDGVTVKEGQITLPDRPGLGVLPTNPHPSP